MYRTERRRDFEERSAEAPRPTKYVELPTLRVGESFEIELTEDGPPLEVVRARVAAAVQEYRRRWGRRKRDGHLMNWSVRQVRRQLEDGSWGPVEAVRVTRTR